MVFTKFLGTDVPEGLWRVMLGMDGSGREEESSKGEEGRRGESLQYQGGSEKQSLVDMSWKCWGRRERARSRRKEWEDEYGAMDWEHLGS